MDNYNKNPSVGEIFAKNKRHNNLIIIFKILVPKLNMKKLLKKNFNLPVLIDSNKPEMIGKKILNFELKLISRVGWFLSKFTMRDIKARLIKKMIDFISNGTIIIIAENNSSSK